MSLMRCDPQMPVRRGFWGAVTRSRSHTTLEREEKEEGGRRVKRGFDISPPPWGVPYLTYDVTVTA